MASPEFTELARGFYLEGLAFDHARQAVWYSDVTGGGIHGVRLDGSKIAVLNPDRMWAGGIMLNHDGAVLSSGRHGIMWNHPERGISGWLIDQIDGTPINGINEMMPDGQGGILFGTIDLDMIVAGKDTRGAALYRLAADRSVTRLAAEIAFTNGIMFDAERQRLYCNETFRCCWAFDVGADFTLSNRTKAMLTAWRWTLRAICGSPDSAPARSCVSRQTVTCSNRFPRRMVRLPSCALAARTPATW